MEESRLPSDWDWVTERHACSVRKFFERLRVGAESNVKTRKALRLELVDRGPIEFVSAGDTFSVTRTMSPEGPYLTVRVILAGQKIRFEVNGGDIAFEGALTLTDKGECRLNVNGADLDVWQVLKRALEPIFFAS